MWEAKRRAQGLRENSRLAKRLHAAPKMRALPAAKDPNGARLAPTVNLGMPSTVGLPRHMAKKKKGIKHVASGEVGKAVAAKAEKPMGTKPAKRDSRISDLVKRWDGEALAEVRNDEPKLAALHKETMAALPRWPREDRCRGLRPRRTHFASAGASREGAAVGLARSAREAKRDVESRDAG